MRDYFAAAALQGWLATFAEIGSHPSAIGTEHDVAVEAYLMADAMLKAREKP